MSKGSRSFHTFKNEFLTGNNCLVFCRIWKSGFSKKMFATTIGSWKPPWWYTNHINGGKSLDRKYPLLWWWYSLEIFPENGFQNSSDCMFISYFFFFFFFFLVLSSYAFQSRVLDSLEVRGSPDYGPRTTWDHLSCPCHSYPEGYLFLIGGIWRRRSRTVLLPVNLVRTRHGSGSSEK